MFRANVIEFSYYVSLDSNQTEFVTVATFQIGEQVGSSLGSTLIFAPAPDNAAAIGDYLQDLLQRGLDTHSSSSDSKIILKFWSLVLLGM